MSDIPRQEDLLLVFTQAITAEIRFSLAATAGQDIKNNRNASGNRKDVKCDRQVGLTRTL
jgi:hypothetical protein